MEPDPLQAIDAPHSPNEHHIRSPFPLESRPEPMVIMSRSFLETTDEEPRKRRRLANGGGSQDEEEGWNRDSYMALAVRVADLQAKIVNLSEDSKQLKGTNSALESRIAELKAQAVKDHSKLRKNTERHVAELKDIEKQHSKDVADLKTKHSAEVKDLQDQNAKYKRAIAAWDS